MAAGAGRQHAVEHVHATRDGFDDIDRLADPHQIARPVGGQHGRRKIQHLDHGCMPLTHGQPADGIAVIAGLDQPLSRLAAQDLVDAPLLDAEQRLALTLPEGDLGPRAPSCRASHGVGRLFTGRWQGHQFIQLHDNVGAQQIRLDLDGSFGR